MYTNKSRQRVELTTLLSALRSQGYQPMGVIFYDPKLKLLGLAPLAAVPDAWTEMVGKRLGNIHWSEVSPA